MEYSLLFKQSLDANKVDEFYINFKGSKEEKEQLKYFIDFYQNKKIFINLVPFFNQNIFQENIKFFNKLYGTYQNFVIGVWNIFKDITEDNKNKIKFPYCALSTAVSLDDIKEYINLGVSEIYINQGLLFDLDAVTTLTKPYNIRLRYLLNNENGDYLNKSFSPILSAFIRPEDIRYYDKYIDTIVIGSNYEKSPETILEIYKEQDWKGDLSTLIPYLPKINNKTILFNFANNRLNCKRKCLKGTKPHCYKCIRTFSLAQHLDEKEIAFQDFS